MYLIRAAGEIWYEVDSRVYSQVQSRDMDGWNMDGPMTVVALQVTLYIG